MNRTRITLRVSGTAQDGSKVEQEHTGNAVLAVTANEDGMGAAQIIGGHDDVIIAAAVLLLEMKAGGILGPAIKVARMIEERGVLEVTEAPAVQDPVFDAIHRLGRPHDKLD